MESKYHIEDSIEKFCHTFSILKTKHNHIRYVDLADGFIFVEILKCVPAIQISSDQLDDSQGKWILKLSNLKKIITRLQSYCSTKLNKTLMSKDIDLIQVSKNNSPEQILKYFELIIAVVMQSPQKQDYIQKIMSLDQKSQSIFVNIIQNALEKRITLSAKHQTIKLQDEIKMLKQQNEHLRDEMSFFTRTNKNLSKQMEQLKDKLREQAEQIQLIKYSQIQKTNESLTIQLTQQRNLTQNLKNKLLSVARQHQIQISKYQQQISIFELKLQHLESVQNNLEMYKEKYTQALKEGYRKQEVEKEKRKLHKEIDDKDLIIKKLNDRISQYEAKRQNMQENQLHMKMELQKKQVRFKQLQKQVRNRLNQPDTVINTVSLPSVILQQSLQDQRLQNHLEQMEFTQAEIQKLRNSNRQLERQSMKNKKKLQKLNQLQKQKKKLQRMILEVSKSRDAQIEMLVVSMWELRNQNVKIFQLLQQKNQSLSR